MQLHFVVPTIAVKASVLDGRAEVVAYGLEQHRKKFSASLLTLTFNEN